MAALTDLLTKVGLPGTVTSLSSPGKAIGATSINIGSATNWPTATAVYFAIRRVDPTLVTATNPSGTVPGTYTEWKGVVAGTTVAINPTPAYGTDQVYPAGTNTQVYVVISAARENALVDWGLGHADQVGALLPAAVQTAIGTGGITNTNLAGGITYAKLLSTIFSGQVATYTNAGSAGGTFSYVNLGGIKLFWGKTAPISISGSGFQSTTRTVTLGGVAFSNIQTVQLTTDQPTATQYLTAGISTSSASSLDVNLNQMNGTNGVAAINVFIVGN